MRALVLAAVTVAQVAGAVETTGVFGETPRNFFFEAKVGVFTPLIDRAFTSSPGPYQTIFGNSPMILAEAELDFEIFQKVGSLSVGISGGYAEKFGRAIDPSTGQKSVAPTGLKVYPLKALVIYRFDYFSLKKGVPLVPYLKAGGVMIPWSVVNGSDIEVADNLRGTGIKYGYTGVAGLAFTLDYLDQRLSRDFDNSMGVNHTYLFGEFALQEITNFGTQQKTDLDLSSRHWIFGLAFEF